MADPTSPAPDSHRADRHADRRLRGRANRPRLPRQRRPAPRRAALAGTRGNARRPWPVAASAHRRAARRSGVVARERRPRASELRSRRRACACRSRSRSPRRASTSCASAATTRRRSRCCARVFTWAPTEARATGSTPCRHRDRVHATGAATIGTDAPLAVFARANLAPAGEAALPWQGSVEDRRASRPARDEGLVRVEAHDGRPAQTLDARAVVRPFAAWPLGELHASVEAIDLAVFASDAPTTSLSGRAVVTTTGSDQPAIVSLDLANARAGRWNEGRLPVQPRRAALRDPTRRTSSIVDAEGRAGSAPARPDGSSHAAAGARPPGTSPPISPAFARLRSTPVRPRPVGNPLLGNRFAAHRSGFAGARRPPSNAPRVDVVAQLAGSSSILVCRAACRAPPACASKPALRTTTIELRAAGLRSATRRASGAGKLARTGADKPWRATASCAWSTSIRCHGGPAAPTRRSRAARTGSMPTASST